METLRTIPFAARRFVELHVVPDSPDPRRGERRRQRVLLIDDDESVRAVVEAGLETVGGFEISMASNGRMGLELIESVRPDILMVDLLLPIIDGFEVLAELRSRPASERPGRVIVMTAQSEPLPAATLREFGVDVLLPKPFYLRQLIDAVTGH